MRLFASLALSLAAIAPNATAADVTERDRIRSGYLEGFSCSRVVRGQPITFRFFEGGTGRVEWQEDDASILWSVKNDEMCIKIELQEPFCTKFPDTIVEGEKEGFREGLGESCF